MALLGTREIVAREEFGKEGGHVWWKVNWTLEGAVWYEIVLNVRIGPRGFI